MASRKKNVVPIPAYLTMNPNGIEKGYVRITKSLVCSQAFKELSGLAVVMYLDMLIEAKGEGKVTYSQSYAHKRLGISKGGYTASIQRLCKWGFIERIPRSCFAPSQYYFVEEWKYKNQTAGWST